MIPTLILTAIVVGVFLYARNHKAQVAADLADVNSRLASLETTAKADISKIAAKL